MGRWESGDSADEEKWNSEGYTLEVGLTWCEVTKRHNKLNLSGT